MRSRNIAVGLATLGLTVAPVVASATSAEAAAPVHYQSFACKTTGKTFGDKHVHGTVKYGYQIIKGKVVPYSARAVGTTKYTIPRPQGRSWVYTYRNASVSTDSGSAMHTSSANPVTFYAKYGYLPKSANNTTVTIRWNVHALGGNSVLACTSRVAIPAPARSSAQNVGTKWENAPRIQQVGTKWESTGAGKTAVLSV